LDKNLHIVCFDVPYPVLHGGMFDLYYKIKALKEKGIAIYLHCYDYGKGRQPELNKYCVEVHYYPRQLGWEGFSLTIPYIVSSRTNSTLTQRLLENNYPILIEGIHSSFFVADKRFSTRKIFLRLHNVEYQYYHQLYTHSPWGFKKLYYWYESNCLQRYESAMAKRLPILAVSEKDKRTYQQKWGAMQVQYLPVFAGWQRIQIAAGKGNYCLYHGNLSIPENEKAAIWLLENIFNTLTIPFVIAGKNPSLKLERMVHQQSHTCLIANPAEDEMRDLVTKAQVNTLPAFSKTGIKLKLVNALFNGRHCVVNEAAVAETTLHSICHVANTAAHYKEMVEVLYHRVLLEEEIINRGKNLQAVYNDSENADALIAWIWKH
jgi:hypothetical protein